MTETPISVLQKAAEIGESKPHTQATPDALVKSGRSGRYITLSRLKKERPEVIQEIIRLRGEWMGKLRIGKIVHCDHRTVAAVCKEYPEEIQEAQKRRAANLRSAADSLVELIEADPDSVPPHMRALAAAQLINTAQLIDGAPTEIHEHRERIDIFAEFKAFVASANVEASLHASNAPDKD